MSKLNGNQPIPTGLPTRVPPLVVAFGSLAVAASSATLSIKTFKVAWDNRKAVAEVAQAVGEVIAEETTA